LRITYYYRNYPESKRATDYSRDSERAGTYLAMFGGTLSLGTLVILLVVFAGESTFSDKLFAIGSLLFIILYWFWVISIRPTIIEHNIRKILEEERIVKEKALLAESIDSFCEDKYEAYLSKISLKGTLIKYNAYTSQTWFADFKSFLRGIPYEDADAFTLVINSIDLVSDKEGLNWHIQRLIEIFSYDIAEEKKQKKAIKELKSIKKMFK